MSGPTVGAALAAAHAAIAAGPPSIDALAEAAEQSAADAADADRDAKRAAVRGPWFNCHDCEEHAYYDNTAHPPNELRWIDGRWLCANCFDAEVARLSPDDAVFNDDHERCWHGGWPGWEASQTLAGFLSDEAAR